MSRLVLASALALAIASAGCSSVPTTAAIQRTAVGGGFIATGSLGLAGSAVVAGVALASPKTPGIDTTTPLLIGAGVGAGVSIAELVLGGVLLGTAAEDLDALSAQAKRADDSDRARRLRREVERDAPRTKRERREAAEDEWKKADEAREDEGPLRPQ